MKILGDNNVVFYFMGKLLLDVFVDRVCFCVYI